MRLLPKFLLLLGAIGLLSRCANRDRWLNRQWHSLNGHYNLYFNANEILKQSQRSLEQQHQNDFQEVLSVFQYADEKARKGEKENLKPAIEKATEVIQQHRVGRWVDDSWLLIGKCYLFGGDHFLAIETFRYVNSQYKDKPIADRAMIWLARTYLLMERHGDGRAALTVLKTKGSIPEDVRTPYMLTEAALAIGAENYREAISPLRQAIPELSDKDQRIRCEFILGQLYRRTGQGRLASEHFRKVARSNPPYALEFQAKLNLARSYQSGSPQEARELHKFLISMLRDEKNAEYLDQIYYELALLEIKRGRREKALQYLNQSLRAAQNNKDQKALAYIKSAELSLEAARYADAKAYYDSASTFMEPDFPDYEQIKAKKQVLTRLIDNLTTIQRQDSLLALSRLDRSALDTKIDTLIARRQRREARQKAAQEAEGEQGEATESASSRFDAENRLKQRQQARQDFGSGSNWYFYNPSAIGQGFSRFVQQWGRRPLQDNWRFQEKAISQNTVSDAPSDTDSLAQSQAREVAESGPQQAEDAVLRARLDTIAEDKQPYYRDIPFGKAQQQAARSKMAEAYTNVGLIYAEEIGNVSEAIGAFQPVIRRFRDLDYYVQSLYRLYKLHHEKGDTATAQAYRDTLLNRFPESDYALLVENPAYLRERARLREHNPTLEALYQKGYTAYQAHRCDSLARYRRKAERTVEFNYYEGRFAYLHLLCRRQTDTAMADSAFVKQLESLLEQYEEEPVAEHIRNTIAYLQKPKEDSAKPKPEPIYDTDYVPEPQFYLMTFPLGSANPNRVLNEFNNFNDRKGYKNLLMSNQMLNKDTTAIVVRGFEGVPQAVAYYRQVAGNDELFERAKLKKYQHFVISRTNFITLRKKQALDRYVAFFKEQYLNQTASKN